MLSDPVRAVRIVAARGLSALSAEEIAVATPAFEVTLVEYMAAQHRGA